MEPSTAARIIQVWYRKRRLKRQSQRKSVDEALENTVSGTFSGLELFLIGQKLLKVYNPLMDVKRFLKYTQAVLASMESCETKVWYVSVALNKDHSVEFIRQLKWLLKEAIKSLKHLQPGMPKDEQFIKPYLTALIVLTDYTLWKLTERGGDALKPVLHKLCTTIITHLMDNGLFASLHELMLNGLSHPAVRLGGHQLQAAMGLRTIALCGFSDQCLSLFVSHVLSVPACIWHLHKLHPEGVIQLVKVNLNSRILKYLSNKAATVKTELLKKNKTEILAIFGNLLELKQIDLTLSIKDQATNESLDDGVFQEVMNQLLSSVQHEKKQMSTATWHLLFGWSDHFLDRRLLDCLPHLHKQLCLLWHGSLVNLLFEPILQLNLAQSKPTKSRGFSFKSLIPSNPTKMTKMSLDRVLAAARFYHLCVESLPQMSTEILIGLSCNHKLPSRLWYFLSGVLGVQVKDCISALMSPSTDRHASVIMIMCKVTQYLLSVLDDKELFEDQKYFPLNDLKSLTNFLNNLVFTCLWDHALTKSHTSSSTSSLISSCVALLSLLLRRNRRMPFMTDVDLQVKGFRTIMFMSEWKSRVPRAMELLDHMPHLIPHQKRIEIFYEYIKAEKTEMGIMSGHSRTPATYITIHRSRLLETGFQQLSSLPATAIKGVIRVNFVNLQGLDEAGIDEMGVFKEFLEETIKIVFDPGMSLFKTNADGLLYPSPASGIQGNHLDLLEFTGKMLGKAVYEGIVVDVPFAIFFLGHLVKHTHNLLYSSLDELHTMDPDLSKSLHFIKHYEGDVDDLFLTFSFDEEFLGKVVTHELVPGGSGIPVTADNRISYVHHVAHYKMATQIKSQVSAFLRGFHSIINPRWMAMFSPEEFQRVISGDDSDVDLDDLRKHTQYFGGFHDKHPVILWLWDVLKKDFSPTERAAFLKFVTSCSRPPLLGFSQLDPPFTIRRVDTGEEEESISVTRTIRSLFNVRATSQERLPTSSTCFNLLKLPHYATKKILKEKLLFSISSNSGFELS